MPLFQRKENKKVDEKSLAVRSGNATGYQKTEEYRKGRTGMIKEMLPYMKNFSKKKWQCKETKQF